jgi:hypothetical protein
MDLLNKDENWWLRLTIVLISMTALSTLAYYNRQVTQIMVKSQLDSLKIENLEDSIFQINHESGINELIIDDLNETKKWKGIKTAIDFERDSTIKYE